MSDVTVTRNAEQSRYEAHIDGELAGFAHYTQQDDVVVMDHTETEDGFTPNINVIASPLQSLRDVFDLMPTASADDWATLATRMGRVPDALDQWTASLTAAATKGEIAPLRQYERCIEQCADLTAPDGYFAGLLTDARTDDGPLPDSVAADLRRSVEAAASAYRDLASRLAPLRDRAPEADACGRERYALHSRAFLGARTAIKGGSKFIRPVFITVVLALTARLVWQHWFG